jgi:hypothetical protein
MDALHDNHLGACLRIVQARAHHLIPPVEDGTADQIAFGFAHVVRVIDDDPIAALAGRRSTD